MEKINKTDLYLWGLFITQLYYFNLIIQAVSVFSYRVVSATSQLVPFVTVSYAIILFLFFSNFGKFYMALNKSESAEKMELFNSSLISLLVIFFLNIVAELLTSRIQF